jgi:hypothetical protein
MCRGWFPESDGLVSRAAARRRSCRGHATSASTPLSDADNLVASFAIAAIATSFLASWRRGFCAGACTVQRAWHDGC